VIQDLYVKESGFKGYVEGHHLLHLLEARMDKATKLAPPGGADGTRTNPFTLDPLTPGQWLGMIDAQNRMRDRVLFMNWDGRRLAINARLYVFDDGAAGSPTPQGEWKPGLRPEGSSLHRSHPGHAAPRTFQVA